MIFDYSLAGLVTAGSRGEAFVMARYANAKGEGDVKWITSR